MTPTIKLEIKENSAHLIFNRPDVMNTYNEAMSLDLLQVISELKKISGLRLLVLRGKGPVFMAGGDVQSLAQLSKDDLPKLRELANRLHEVVLFFRSLSCPVIAAVHGAVAGAGLSLMLAADLTIASTETKFNLAYAQLGASVDGGASYFLPRLIGMRRAMELMLLSPRLTADQAFELGLINQLASTEDFNTQVNELSEQLSNGPTLAYAHMKHLMNVSWGNSLEKQLELEAQSFVECAQTHDFKQGVQGFLKKEPVLFTGT